jgi:hypothetical protein
MSCILISGLTNKRVKFLHEHMSLAARRDPFPDRLINRLFIQPMSNRKKGLPEEPEQPFSLTA